MVRRYAYVWLTCRDASRPSVRSWARQLGVSHVWLLKLVRRFKADPEGTRRQMVAMGDPKPAELMSARASSQEMRERGELRPRS